MGPLFDQAGFRAGGRGTRASWSRAVADHLQDLYGPVPVLLLLSAAVAVALVLRGPADGRSDAWWRPAGLRPVAAVLVVAIVGYTLVFRNGAAVHDYWTYWGVALVAVGVAAVAQLVLAASTRSPRAALRVAGPVAVAVVVAIAALTGTVRETTAERRIREGLDLLPILDQVPDAPRPTAAAVAVYGAPGELPWADINTRGRAVPVDDVDALRQLPPDLPVLVVLRGPPSAALRARATASNDRFVLLPASALIAHLEG